MICEQLDSWMFFVISPLSLVLLSHLIPDCYNARLISTINDLPHNQNHRTYKQKKEYLI